MLQEKLRLASSATEGSQQAADAAAVHVGVLQAGLAAAEQQKAAADARVLQLQQELEQERLRNAELSRQLEGTPTPDTETPRTSQPGQVPPTPPTDYLPPLPDSDSDDGSDEEGPPPPEGLAADSFGVLPPFGGMTGGNNSWTQFKHQSRQMAAGLYRLLHNHTADQPLQMNKLWVLQGGVLQLSGMAIEHWGETQHPATTCLQRFQSLMLTTALAVTIKCTHKCVQARCGVPSKPTARWAWMRSRGGPLSRGAASCLMPMLQPSR